LGGDAVSWFREEPRGILVAVDYSKEGPTFVVWFDYSRSYVRSIREGDMVAVRSFVSENGSEVYSVLELSTVIPVHYALGSSSADIERAFPGFVVEAARSARQDWEQEKPEEESTKIKCLAIATGIQLRFGKEGGPGIEDDQSLPMVGEEANLLTDALMEQVVNRGIRESKVPTISPGQLVLNPHVDVLMKVEDLLRTHFGIFGFTGAGKSNLVSTLVAEMAQLKEQKVKVVLFDLMSEYHPLLADIIHGNDTAYVVALDEDSVPGGDATLKYFRGEGTSEEAARSIARVALLPAELNSLRSSFERCFKAMLEAGRFRILDQVSEPPAPSELRDPLVEALQGNIGLAKTSIEGWISRSTGGSSATFEQIKSWANELEGYARNKSFPSAETTQGLDGSQSHRMVDLSPTGVTVVYQLAAILRGYVPSDENRPPEKARLSESDLVNSLTRDDGKSALYVIQSDSDDNLRLFSSRIVNRVFYRRRRGGIIRPLALFAYDEADEFIPREAGPASYIASSASAETLARRGRKFGMGLAISTQRVAFLNTKILGQPHTYLVSKLPRKYDRDTMADAFGADEDMLTRTLRFTKGQWLLVSYDATGLQNVPVPVKFPNANERVRDHLASDTKPTQQSAS
jgi:Helicase HerA, central domain